MFCVWNITTLDRYPHLTYRAWNSWLPWIDITARRYVPSKTCWHLTICICSHLRGKMPKGKVKTNPRLLISHKLISYIHEDWTDIECLSGLKSLTFLLIFCCFICIILCLKCSVLICFGGSLYLHLVWLNAYFSKLEFYLSLLHPKSLRKYRALI